MVQETTQGDLYYGRTMEFGFELDSVVSVVPRALALNGTGMANQTGLESGGMKWTSKYAFTAMNALGEMTAVDGVNEKGLVCGLLYFPNYANYSDAATADPETALAPWTFCSWALSLFQTVDEVRNATSAISVVGLTLSAPGFSEELPAHWTLHDATGKSIVVEPVEQTLKVYDNPFRAMTNAPEFPWHVTNIANYVKLSPYNAPPLELAGQVIQSFGEGSGWLGLPGDMTPPSRFIRAIAGSMTSVEIGSNSTDTAVRLVEHIMNDFDIPQAMIRDNATDVADYTQWTTIADLQTCKYYVKTYNDQMLQSVDLFKFDLDADHIVSAPIVDHLAVPALPFVS